MTSLPLLLRPPRAHPHDGVRTFVPRRPRSRRQKPIRLEDLATHLPCTLEVQCPVWTLPSTREVSQKVQDAGSMAPAKDGARANAGRRHWMLVLGRLMEPTH